MKTPDVLHLKTLDRAFNIYSSESMPLGSKKKNNNLKF